MTKVSDFALELLSIEADREAYANTLIEIRQILGISDHTVWTQDVLRDRLQELAELKGESTPKLRVVSD